MGVTRRRGRAEKSAQIQSRGRQITDEGVRQGGLCFTPISLPLIKPRTIPGGGGGRAGHVPIYFAFENKSGFTISVRGVGEFVAVCGLLHVHVCMHLMVCMCFWLTLPVLSLISGGHLVIGLHDRGNGYREDPLHRFGVSHSGDVQGKWRSIGTGPSVVLFLFCGLAEAWIKERAALFLS